MSDSLPFSEPQPTTKSQLLDKLPQHAKFWQRLVETHPELQSWHTWNNPAFGHVPKDGEIEDVVRLVSLMIRPEYRAIFVDALTHLMAPRIIEIVKEVTK